MKSRIWTTLAALIAGILIGAVVMQVLAPPVSGTSVPSHSMATATGCQDADDPRGWIGVVPDVDYGTVYLGNYSYSHDVADVEIRGELTESTTNAWVFAITVTPGDGEKEVPDDCQPRSMMDASIAVPPTTETLTITIDGETIVVVDTTVNSPHFSYIDG